MSPARQLLLALACAAAVTGASCGDPPDKEIQQAQGAIDAARAAGADQFARDEFSAAEAALKRAHDAVDERDYRQALNAALDARERAQTAAKEAVNGKATARAEADKALAAATAALDEARARLKTAESRHVGPRTLNAARSAVAADATAVQEARTAFGRGDYLASIDRAKAAAAHLHASTRDLDAAVPTTGRRRR